MVAIGLERKAAGDEYNAAEMFGAAIAADNDHVWAYCNLASLAVSNGFSAAGIAMGKRAVAIDPGDRAAWCNLGNHLWRAQRFAEAEEALLTAVKLGHNGAALHINLGLLYFSTGRTAQSLAAFEAAHKADPNLDIDSDHAHIVLKAGDLAKGLELLEARWTSGILKKTLPWACGLPRWTGEKASAQTILLYHEQGYGDTLQFIRFVPAIKEESGGASIIFACPKSLHRLLKDQCGIDELIDDNDAAAIVKVSRVADYHSPLMSAVSVLKPHYALVDEFNHHGVFWGEYGYHIPATPYLKPPLERADIFHPGGTKLSVGICWGAAVVHGERAVQKSCSVEEMLELGTVPGVKLWSLQFGPYAEQLHRAGANRFIAEVPGGLGDFAETAAIVDKIDAVVTVDTAMAHLAGSIGKTVFMLNPINPCWRWTRGAAPWYSTMELFDQAVPDNWKAPIQQVKKRITQLMEGK